MIAIISATTGHIRMYAFGSNEDAARVEAAHFLAGGYSEEAYYEGRGFRGGHAVRMCLRLHDLMSRNDTWDSDGAGGSSANQVHFDKLEAESHLFVNEDGELDSRFFEKPSIRIKSVDANGTSTVSVKSRLSDGELVLFLFSFFLQNDQLPPARVLAERFDRAPNAVRLRLLKLERKGVLERNSVGKFKFSAKTWQELNSWN